jgi:hypothetical protein
MKAHMNSYVIHVDAKENHRFLLRKDSIFYDEEDEDVNGEVYGLPHSSWRQFLAQVKQITKAFDVDESPYWDYYEFSFFVEDVSQIESAKHMAQKFVEKHFYEKAVKSA